MSYNADMRTKWLALCAFLVGCGGGGSTGTVITDPVHLSILARIAGINSENISQVMDTYDPAFFEDCRNWSQQQTYWQGIFNGPAYSVANLRGVNVVYTTQVNARIDCFVDVTNNGNTVAEQWVKQYRLQNGLWRELGDGSCP